MSLPMPVNEEQRLAALRRYEVLDTDPEEGFDDLTFLASQICGTPISLVSLVDADRQWFKSRVGVDVTETARDIAFCAHGVLEDDLFIVPDAEADERFKDNPMVTGEAGIRFYAGAPLITEDGFALGMMCVKDKVPRNLDETQREALRALGRQAVSQLELRRKLRELERAVEERDRAEASKHEAEAVHRTLAEQNERLRELDRMKDDFVASVSHELRTPLTSIRGYLELVLDGEAGELSPDQRQFLQVVGRNADRLLRVVGDLLFVAQVDAGKIALESGPVVLEALAGEAVEAARPVAEEKELELSLAAGELPAVVGDRARLAQVLDNLVSNAIKFTPAGGRVEVRTFRSNGHAVFEIADSGIGIAAADQQRLFERFFRTAAATDQAIQGTGLGLAIVKAIVDGHGGRISVQSEPGAGTTFRVELPTQPVQEASHDDPDR